jgi:hypothetical protein
MSLDQGRFVQDLPGGQYNSPDLRRVFNTSYSTMEMIPDHPLPVPVEVSAGQQ